MGDRALSFTEAAKLLKVNWYTERLQIILRKSGSTIEKAVPKKLNGRNKDLSSARKDEVRRQTAIHKSAEKIMNNPCRVKLKL